MANRTKWLVIYGLGILTGILIVSQMAFKDNEKEKKKQEEREAAYAAQYTAPRLPDRMSFAGEPVPLDRPEIREMFDRELIYNYYSQGHMIYLQKLANRFFPVLEPLLKQEGLPDDFKYLCVAESNLQALTSGAGAQGYWQFMKASAPEYGLEVSADVDERNDVVKSTRAACKYLKQAYNKFGNWTAAAASYNCGMGGYQSQVSFQKTKYYYDLQLPTETNKYIFRILTFKHIMSQPDKLGFHLEKDDLYPEPPTRIITVSKSIPDLADWALSNGTTYKMVKWYNPWLRSRSLAVRPGKTYDIVVPAGK